MVDENPDDVLHSVCDPALPDAGEGWDGVVGKSGEWLEQARTAGGLGWKWVSAPLILCIRTYIYFNRVISPHY